jgi:hypothetical protein
LLVGRCGFDEKDMLIPDYFDLDPMGSISLVWFKNDELKAACGDYGRFLFVS